MSRLLLDRRISFKGRMRYYYLSILALSGFVTSFGAHIVATNLPSYAEVAGVGALMIGLLIAIYDLAELFVKPFAGFVADRHGAAALSTVSISLVAKHFVQGRGRAFGIYNAIKGAG